MWCVSHVLFVCQVSLPVSHSLQTVITCRLEAKGQVNNHALPRISYIHLQARKFNTVVNIWLDLSRYLGCRYNHIVVFVCCKSTSGGSVCDTGCPHALVCSVECQCFLNGSAYTSNPIEQSAPHSIALTKVCLNCESHLLFLRHGTTQHSILIMIISVLYSNHKRNSENIMTS